MLIAKIDPASLTCKARLFREIWWIRAACCVWLFLLSFSSQAVERCELWNGVCLLLGTRFLPQAGTVLEGHLKAVLCSWGGGIGLAWILHHVPVAAF